MELGLEMNYRGLPEGGLLLGCMGEDEYKVNMYFNMDILLDMRGLHFIKNNKMCG